MPDEFGLIAKLFAPLAASFPGALGLRDDAALIDGPAGSLWAVTTDALVAGVHFLADDPPDLVARKVIRVNLSDLAAMGARPVAILLAACFPVGVGDGWLERFAIGLKGDCETFSIALIGGDTVATPGPLSLTLTAFGQVPAGKALLRSNARSGDRLWMSGTLGDAAFGLFVARGEANALDPSHAAALAARYRLPEPRLALGQALVGLASAAMDISDGLVGDLGHICAASGVGAVIETQRLPLSEAGAAAMAAGMGQGLITVLTGGDDYELLFAAPPDADGAIEALSARLDLRLSIIGRIVDGDSVAIVGPDGRPVEIGRGGYRHFGG